MCCGVAPNCFHARCCSRDPFACPALQGAACNRKVPDRPDQPHCREPSVFGSIWHHGLREPFGSPVACVVQRFHSEPPALTTGLTSVTDFPIITGVRRHFQKPNRATGRATGPWRHGHRNCRSKTKLDHVARTRWSPQSARTPPAHEVGQPSNHCSHLQPTSRCRDVASKIRKRIRTSSHLGFLDVDSPEQCHIPICR